MWRDLETVNLVEWELRSILRATLSRASCTASEDKYYGLVLTSVNAQYNKSILADVRSSHSAAIAIETRF